jgi:hypothetical protein
VTLLSDDAHAADGVDALDTVDEGSWAAVLAAVELDVRRTQALLAATPAEPPTRCAGAPAEAMLPSTGSPAAIRQYSDAAWAELPAFQDMPPVPEALSERIRALRADILALQVQLTAELAQWRATQTARRPRELAPAASGAAFFVDRRA